MARAQLFRERASQAADEADFRAASANLFQRDEERWARPDQVVLPPQRHDADDDEPDCMSPQYNLCMRAEGPEGILKHTNFSPEAFERIWDRVQDGVALWKLGHAFKIVPSTFQKMVCKFLGVLSPFLYETYVECADDSWSMGKLVRSGDTFQMFGSMNEIMRYCSGKHHLYRYKVEVSVLPNGIAINCTDHKGGRESDIELFRGNSAFHTRALNKLPNENALSDGLLVEAFPKEWTALTDKSYQGLANDFHTVHPTKHRRLQPLSLAESRLNDDISRDDVVVLNFFGRLKTLWGICSDKWKWDKRSYDLFYRTWVILSYISVRLRPLRDDEGNLYEK